MLCDPQTCSLESERMMTAVQATEAPAASTITGPLSPALLDRAPDTLRLVYVGSPLGAPTQAGVLRNYRRALLAMRLLISEGVVPVAPHALFPLLLDEHSPAERRLGILLDMALLPRFDEVALFTPDGTAATMSSGMRADFERATACGVPIRFRVLPDVEDSWCPSFLMPGLRSAQSAGV
jgi:hypothetical protein